MTYAEQINRTRVPRHIAIIMDGNGRWAKERGLDRSEGHRKGLDVVHEMTDAAAEVGVEYLTLYAFLPKTGIVPRPRSTPSWPWLSLV